MQDAKGFIGSSVNNYLERVLEIKDLADSEVLKSVRFSVCLTPEENIRLQKVCQVLGILRATFSAGIIMNAVYDLEVELDLDTAEHVQEILKKLREEEKKEKEGGSVSE